MVFERRPSTGSEVFSLFKGIINLRASSPIWSSEASLARTRERAAKPPRSRVLARLASLAQIGELARRLPNECRLKIWG